MRKRMRSFLTKSAMFALFATVALGMSETLTAKAWSYAEPEQRNYGKVTNYLNGKVHNGWTMLDYANASSYWGVGNGAITSDPATDYWNGNPVVYKYGLGTKVVFNENAGKLASASIGTHTYTRILSAGEEVPVWYWEAVDNPVACHNSATGATDPFIYKGFTFRKQKF